MKAPTVETELKDLPRTLHELRKKHNLTLKTVAMDTGLSISFICDIEKGRTNPSLETIHKLAKIYFTFIKVIF